MAARKKATPPAKVLKEVPAELMGAMEQEAGGGFEGVTAEDFSIPFILILQKNSPQCDEDSDAYVEGARPGMFWDSGAMAILCNDGGTPLEVIHVTPVYYERLFVQWRDRDAGSGGFVASHAINADIVGTASRDERGRLQLQDDTYLADTRQFYSMLYSADRTAARPVILSMASTQIKKARQWMTRMADFKVDGKNGKFNPPLYGQIWDLGTMGEAKNTHTWKGWRIGEPQLVTNAALFQRGKELRESIMSGAVKAAAPAQGGPIDDSPPFDGDSGGGAF